MGGRVCSQSLKRFPQNSSPSLKVNFSSMGCQEPDNGAPLHYITTAPAPPLAQAFKAPMTVLARKPMIAKRDPVTGLAGMSIRDDSDDEKDGRPQETPEEIRARQQRELEEKQRRYEEARAKIFGDSSSGGGGGGGGIKGGSGRSSGASTPGAVTPPRSGSERRGRGRGRGGFRGHGGDRGSGSSAGDFQRSNSHTGGGASLRDEGRERELFDPGYSPKPGFPFERRGGGASLSGRSTPRDEDQVIRTPRGPDGGGRGGFGFARRGA
ncbi:hypothetical protein BX600DRAFT_196405 [Xylariales sp. PMI_506]|nr:hypothetical protein BX600DRAFT_196405 [Xylariales sp. PMI_506]